MEQVTEETIFKAFKKYGVPKRSDLEKLPTKRYLNKMKKDLIEKISNVAVNSPTSGMFNKLEKSVANLEASVN